MDLTGRWRFKEEFDFGVDEGFAVIEHKGNKLSGVLEFTEYIQEEAPFKIKCNISGFAEGEKVILKVDEYEIIDTKEEIEYYAETREGIINSNGQIVGSSEDDQGVCGVFVFEKLKP